MKCQREGKERKGRERGEEEASPSLVDSKSPRAEMRGKQNDICVATRLYFVGGKLYRNEQRSKCKMRFVVGREEREIKKC